MAGDRITPAGRGSTRSPALHSAHGAEHELSTSACPSTLTTITLIPRAIFGTCIALYAYCAIAAPHAHVSNAKEYLSDMVRE